MPSSGTPYRFEKAGGYSVISLEPELNDAQWSEIEQIGSSLLDQLQSVSPRAFIVDLSALNYMGSAMVALIVRLWKSARERDGRMVVVNKNPMVLEVLRLAGLSKVWEIETNREDAVKALGMRASLGGGGSNKLVMILGAIVLLAVVAGVAFWLGRAGNSSAPPPVEVPVDPATAPAATPAAAEPAAEKGN